MLKSALRDKRDVNQSTEANGVSPLMYRRTLFVPPGGSSFMMHLLIETWIMLGQASSTLWLKKWYREVNKCMHLWSSKDRWHQIWISGCENARGHGLDRIWSFILMQSILRLWNLMHIWSDCSKTPKHQFSLSPTDDTLMMMVISDSPVCHVTIFIPERCR